MRDIPQHATMQQMREASRKLQYTCRKYYIEPLPESAPWPLRVDQAARRVIYPALVSNVQPPVNLSRWQSFKQWLGGNMRKV